MGTRDEFAIEGKMAVADEAEPAMSAFDPKRENEQARLNRRNRSWIADVQFEAAQTYRGAPSLLGSFLPFGTWCTLAPRSEGFIITGGVG